MRDHLGRWLPGQDDDGRHYLTPADRRKGYLVATRMVAMPSRTRAWLRNKIGRQYRRRPKGEEGG